MKKDKLMQPVGATSSQRLQVEYPPYTPSGQSTRGYSWPVAGCCGASQYVDVNQWDKYSIGISTMLNPDVPPVRENTDRFTYTTLQLGEDTLVMKFLVKM